jgi:hypothetical protein
MFTQVFQYILSLWKKPRVVTTDDLDRWEVSYEKPLTMFDCEKVLVEHGHVVGMTAKVTDRLQIEQTLGPPPSGSASSNKLFLIVALSHPLTWTVFNFLKLSIAWRF